jgi:tetratricopeptide (TPR) repeat protein
MHTSHRKPLLRTIGAVSFLVYLAGAPAASVAQEDALKSVFAIDDTNPQASVPTPEQAMKKPLEMGYHIMLLSEKAEAATKAGDHVAAAQFWLAIGKAVPDRSLAFSKACREYEAIGDYKNAIQNCRAALGKGGVTVDDNLDFVSLLLEKKTGPLDATEIADIDAVSANLEQQLLDPKQGPVLAERIRCELGARLDDVRRLQSCTQKLAKLAPKDPQTLVFSWSLALRQGNLPQAENLLKRAKQNGLPQPALAKMETTLKAEYDRRSPWWQRALRDPRVTLLAAALIALAATAAVLLGRRRQRPRHA